MKGKVGKIERRVGEKQGSCSRFKGDLGSAAVYDRSEHKEGGSLTLNFFQAFSRGAGTAFKKRSCLLERKEKGEEKTV